MFNFYSINMDSTKKFDFYWLFQELNQLKEEYTKLNEEKIDHEKKLNQSKQVLLAARKKINAQNDEIQSQTAELENLKKRINTAGENLNGN